MVTLSASNELTPTFQEKSDVFILRSLINSLSQIYCCPCDVINALSQICFCLCHVVNTYLRAPTLLKLCWRVHESVAVQGRLPSMQTRDRILEISLWQWLSVQK